jgi:dihydroorotase
MMGIKTLEALTVTSHEIKRQQIRFDEKSGLILEVGELKVPQQQLDYYFNDDCLLFAGMGDVHIHAREDVSGEHTYKEDFTSALAAMMNGGVLYDGDMPNNPIPPIDDNSYQAKFSLSHTKTCGHIWHYAGIGPGTKPLSYPVPYKVYMGPSIGELYFKDLAVLDETLKHYQGQWVSFHCEDPEVLEEHKNRPTHHERRPIKAEAFATRDALMLIEKYKLKGKLCHYSSHEGLKMVREARQRGVDVSLEVTPQHLYFDMDHLEEKSWKSYQMNPPIRFEEDRQALLAALKNGEIEYLATDHAPHTKEEKEKGISGLTGLDTYGPFVCWLIKEGLDPRLIAKVTAENPGSFFNHFLPSWRKLMPSYDSYGSGLGFLQEGFRANFTILNTASELPITENYLKTKVAHSPFLGVTLPGKVESLFVGGKKV